jgi:hypothetical protein
MVGVGAAIVGVSVSWTGAESCADDGVKVGVGVSVGVAVGVAVLNISTMGRERSGAFNLTKPEPTQPCPLSRFCGYSMSNHTLPSSRPRTETTVPRRNEPITGYWLPGPRRTCSCVAVMVPSTVGGISAFSVTVLSVGVGFSVSAAVGALLLAPLAFKTGEGVGCAASALAVVGCAGGGNAF